MRPVELVGDDVAHVLQDPGAEQRGREPLRRRAEVSPDRVADVDDSALPASTTQLLLEGNPARFVEAEYTVAVRVHLSIPVHWSSP